MQVTNCGAVNKSQYFGEVSQYLKEFNHRLAIMRVDIFPIFQSSAVLFENIQHLFNTAMLTPHIIDGIHHCPPPNSYDLTI